MMIMMMMIIIIIIIIIIIMMFPLHTSSQSLNAGIGAPYGPLILQVLTTSLHRSS